MVLDRQKVWTDGRNGRTDGRTDDAKTISLRLHREIKMLRSEREASDGVGMCLEIG